MWLETIVNRNNGNTGCPFCSGQKAWFGFNDLETFHPEIAAQANGWNPREITKGGNRKLCWRCDSGHEWAATVSNRVKNGTGCPTCAGDVVIPGVNDLRTKFPSIALEAHGWNPSEYLPFSNQMSEWKCSKCSYIWRVSTNNRTSGNTGCPACAGRALHVGANDLKSQFPELAREAHGWNPEQIVFGSNRRLSWKCSAGHIWETVLTKRTRESTGCPYCSGRLAIKGETDLQTTDPELAAQAYEWDPTQFSRGSDKLVDWKRSNGHITGSRVYERTKMVGCPICTYKQVLAGFNDLLTTDPLIAAQANGWDPSTVTRGSNKRMEWICSLKHIWKTQVVSRTLDETGCPYCSNRRVLAKFNDLASKYPEIAKQANGWDPSTVTPGTHSRKSWKCPEGHTWVTSVVNRVNGTGCPSCAEHGFNPAKPAWLYLLRHDLWGLLQIGITNSPKSRLRAHRKLGWQELELQGPMNGLVARKLEGTLLRFLRSSEAEFSAKDIGGTFSGYTECWVASSFPINSLSQLIQIERNGAAVGLVDGLT